MTDNTTELQRSLRQRALMLDLVCLALCGVLLWCGTNAVLDLWILIAGAVLAVAMLVAAIRCSAKARRLEMQRYDTPKQKKK